jgi:FecR protein/Tetratricopeptide repeat
MSRRSVPRIAPADLRDHADEARVDRIWERLDPALPGAAAPRRPVTYAWIALAASFAAFGGGLLLGKAAFHDGAPASISPITAVEHSTIDVLAAGSEGRSFPLPGGGQLALQPGATVELERSGEGAVTLKLVQGEAAIDTASAGRTAALVIVAGDARLNTQAGSVLNVRRNQDDMDVAVRDGSVSLTSPDGTRKLAGGDHADAVPIHGATAAVSPTSSPLANNARAPLGPRGRRPNDPRHGKPVVVAGPEWLARYNNADYASALALLRQEPGGLAGAIANARSGGELMAISTLARDKSGDPSAAMSALKSLIERFPNDENAQAAAYTLGTILEKAGKIDEAREYWSRAGKLNGPLAENVLCRQIKAAQAAGHKDEAIRGAEEYVAKYPDGPCKDDAEDILPGDGAPSKAAPAPSTAPSAAPSVAPSAPDGPAAGNGGAPK